MMREKEAGRRVGRERESSSPEPVGRREGSKLLAGGSGGRRGGKGEVREEGV